MKRKQREDILQLVLLTIVVALSIVIIALLLHFASNRPAPYERETGTAAESRTIEEENTGEEGNDTPQDMSMGAADSKTEAVEIEVEDTEQDAADTSIVGAESDDATQLTDIESEPEILTDLSQYAPGDRISAKSLDMTALDRYFTKQDITKDDAIYQRINGKSYRENPNVSLSSLTYVRMPHYNFDGEVQLGEMILSKDIVDDAIWVFEELFRNQYQIKSMYLVDNYWTGDGDSTDYASIDVDNTSCFNYRVATGSSKLSNHAYGKAIDLNPLENPYVTYQDGKAVRWAHTNANAYIDRNAGLPHMITHDDLAYKLFTQKGFRWGGDWNNPKDFQHFDKNP